MPEKEKKKKPPQITVDREIQGKNLRILCMLCRILGICSMK
jgi:hypothetical protein